jgi:hypothetical protein
MANIMTIDMQVLQTWKHWTKMAVFLSIADIKVELINYLSSLFTENIGVNSTLWAVHNSSH